MSEQRTEELAGGWLPPAAPDPPPQRPSAFGEPRRAGGGRFRRAGGGLLATLLVIGAKLKTLLLLLPKIKVLTTSGTMLVSVAAYALIWGWKFAAGFVALLFIHEMGHVISSAPSVPPRACRSPRPREATYGPRWRSPGSS